MELRIFAILIIIFGSINLLRMAFFLIASDIYGLLLHNRKKATKFQFYTPTFTVIIPAHNESTTVLDTIKSVLANKYPKQKVEVIVIDDGSTDDTSKIIRKYIKDSKTTRVKLITQKNSGKAVALNNAIRKYADGQLIMCLDADSQIDENALFNAAAHFADPRTAALSANVKIIKRPSLLNLLQRYEYLVCYQMKRAESLLNCEYIVGGIGSTFRRSILQKVGYYDTNTITEDIDLTMKILREGNKNYKAVYGADVIAYTEGVLTISGLIKQRFRWKWGRCQTFYKNLKMFFSVDRKYSKSLTWFYLPFAIFGDIAYFFEPFLLAYITAISIYYKDPFIFISACAVISAYVIFNVLAEDTVKFTEKIKLSLLAPFMYIFFFLLSFVEYVALIKSLSNIYKLKESIDEEKCNWIHVERHTERKIKKQYITTIRPVSQIKITKNIYIRSAVFAVTIYTLFFGTFFIVDKSLNNISQTSVNYSSVPTIEIEEIKESSESTESIDTQIPTKERIYYYVKDGENLWTIAYKFYGDGSLWYLVQTKDESTIVHPGDLVILEVELN